VRRLVVALALAAAVSVGWVGTVSAHANLASSDPAEGADLQAAPDHVRLTFTEPPDPSPDISSIEVLNAAGAQVQQGSVQTIPGDRHSLQVALPPDLPDGVYTVSWHVVSTTDGHPSGGAFAFGVGVDASTITLTPGVRAVTTPAPSPVGVVGKVLLYAGLALLVAAGALGLAVFGGEVPGGGALLWGAAGAVLLGTALVIQGEASAAGVALDTLLGSATGVSLIRLAVAALVTAGCVAFAAAPPRGRAALAVLAAAASATMLMQAWGGHAGGSVLEVLLQWAHFTAIGLWIGGLGVMALRLRAHRDAPPLGEIRRFSSIAGWSLLIVVVTGSLRALNELGGFGAWRLLFDEAYGITLLIKVGVAAVLIGLGAVNRYRGIPAIERGERPATFATVLRAEVLLAVGLFVLTGVLTSFSPQQPASPDRAAAPTNLVVSGSDFATTMNVRLTITPGTVGPNIFRVDVTDFDTGRPLPLTSVDLRFQPEGDASVGTSSLQLAKLGDAWQADGSQLALSGPWSVTVVVQGPGVAQEIPLEVRPRLAQTVSVSRAPGQPDLYAITLPGGEQLQLFLDADVPGPTQLHVTAFDPQGQELPLADVVILGEPPGSAPTTLPVTRFDPGHFVADVDLVPGRWTFDVRATTKAGDTLLASFMQTIAETP
jgi:copper transport protein